MSLQPALPLEKIPNQKWNEPEFENNQLDVRVLRLDLIHPWIQGNKWFKLLTFLKICLEEKKEGFVSMGGPYSNHLIALAFAAKELGKKCIFFIRGEEKEWLENPAIEQMRVWGTEIIPLSRNAFRSFHQNGEKDGLLSGYEHFTWVPMGGSSALAFSELKALGQFIGSNSDFDILALPAATAGTATGLALGLPKEKKMLVVEVLKSQGGLEEDFWRWQSGPKPNVEWISDFHFGGYARHNPILKGFCKRINEENAFQIEPIYSGKCFFAVLDLAKKGHFQAGNRILVLHTGGIFPWNLAQLS